MSKKTIGSNIAPYEFDTQGSVSTGNVAEFKNDGTDIFSIDKDGNKISGSRAALAGTEVDFATSTVLTKTLSSNTTLTIINPIFDKTIMLEIDSPASETLDLPGSVTVIGGGTYDTGGAVNYINIYCNDESTPTYLATIVQ